MADTGMGAALYKTLGTGELCATIEIKMTYFKAITSGELQCHTTLVNRGKRVAYLESSITQGTVLVAKASGTYAIFRPNQSAA
jgi:acyl-CoA thioesterase